MEVILHGSILITLTTFVVDRIIFYKRMKKFENSIRTLCESTDLLADQYIHLTKDYLEIQNALDRNLFVLRELLEATKPMTPTRSNNWDSIKEAFKGPTKAIINERT